PLSGPPGFPLMFPELSGEDRKMAMLYISHADPTERLARIERVKQGIAENTAASSSWTKEKGLSSPTRHSWNLNIDNSLQIAAPRSHNDDNSGEGTESSGSLFPACSAPIAPSGFQLGPSSEGRVIGSTGAHKSQRRRPQAWKRRATGKDLKLPAPLSIPSESGPISSSKRKAAEGFEDLVRLSWEGEVGDQSCTMDRIHLSQVIAEEDRNLVLNTKFQLASQDRLLWGFSKNGRYDSKSAKLHLVQANCTIIANLIAGSVTRDHRHQFYVARNGPVWLSSQIQLEASS
ncbi:hypothetical protein HID58_035298, partial [Brassica napus]